MQDCHVHTNMSHDGKSSFKDYIYIARCKGVDGITFTDHWDTYKNVKTNLETINLNKYYDEYISSVEPDQLTTRFGIEVGLRPDIECISDTLNAIQSKDYDYVIGSTHITKGIDISGKTDFFVKRDEVDAMMCYFEDVYESIKTYKDVINAYGHLDYAIRYAIRDYGLSKDHKVEYYLYLEILDAILEALIRSNIALELNTSGLRYGLSEMHPNKEILRRYKEKGGELITIGSDAHRAEDLGYGFNNAEEVLLGIGFKEYAIYEYNKKEKKRIPTFHSVKTKKY